MGAEAKLVGGGECGALARSIDWSRSRLGPPREWPQSLRTMIDVCLNSRCPFAIYWGPEFVMLYNDDLIPMVGANKHPQAFGRPAFEVLPEIREIIEPLLVQVVTTGEPVWLEDLMLPLLRGEAQEESYFTFTYSPIRIESGAVGGVLCAVIETTTKLLDERRLRLLNALADVSKARTPQDVLSLAASQLANAPLDVPFALLYLFDGPVAALVGSANVDRDSSFTDASRWTFTHARSDVPLDDAPNGARGAVVLPIVRLGGSVAIGFIVIGLSPLLRSGESYLRFHDQVAKTISQAVSNVLAFSEATARADAMQRERAVLYRHFMQTPFPIAVFRTAELVIDLANPAILRAWGQSSAVVGMRLVDAIPELRDQPFLALLAGVFQTGVTYEGREEPARMPTGSGGDLQDAFFNYTYAALRDDDGVIEGVLVTAYDVTDVVVARRVAQAAEQTQRALVEFQERFMAVLGHDLRNPLAAIDMGAEILTHRAASSGDEQAAKQLARVAFSSRRMSRMIEQILDLSRSRIGGGLAVAPVAMDIRPLLDNVIDEVRAAHPTRIVELRAESAPGHWDPDRLEQVFSNLVSNAIHHGRADTVIDVEVTRSGAVTRISVHNHGAPIPEDVRATLFSPFRRGRGSENRAKTAGLGLGLYISRELVVAHGGEIEVVSTEQDGTTIVVTLPHA